MFIIYLISYLFFKNKSFKFTKLKAKSVTPKAQNCDITHFCDKTALNLEQILQDLKKKLKQTLFAHLFVFFHLWSRGSHPRRNVIMFGHY